MDVDSITLRNLTVLMMSVLVVLCFVLTLTSKPSDESYTVYEGIFVDMEISAGGFAHSGMIIIQFENSSLSCQLHNYGDQQVFMEKGHRYLVTVSSYGYLESYEEVVG